MNTIKEFAVGQLNGAALDLVVGLVEGCPVHPGPDILVADDVGTVYAHERAYSRDWKFGGPIIERERITIDAQSGGGRRWWRAWRDAESGRSAYHQNGQFALQAAMRCYVTSKIGEVARLELDSTGRVARLVR